MKKSKSYIERKKSYKKENKILKICCVSIGIGMIIFMLYQYDNSDFEILQRSCYNESIKIGDKFIRENTMECDRTIEDSSIGWVCFGDECDYESHNKRCYTKEDEENYPCYSFYCKFDDILVKEEEFSENITIWEDITKQEEICEYNQTDKLIIDNKKIRLSKKWLDDNCEYVEVEDEYWELENPYWDCSEGEYRIKKGKTEINKAFFPYLDIKGVFKGYVEEFQTDKEVLRVVNLCKADSEKVECVYDNIPFQYDFNRAEYAEDGVTPLTPTELTEGNGFGVCRDISIFRMAVLKRLDVEARFVLEPDHIYIVAKENGKTYKLNNEYIY